MNYQEIAKETVEFIYKSRESLRNSPVKPEIRVLAELRVSQINGCAYCCRLHSDEARKLGLDQNSMYSLVGDMQAVLTKKKKLFSIG